MKLAPSSFFPRLELDGDRLAVADADMFGGVGEMVNSEGKSVSWHVARAGLVRRMACWRCPGFLIFAAASPTGLAPDWLACSLA